MATETAPSPAPASPKQIETITRLERATGVPKAQRKDATTMTRQQASAYISDLIARTQADDDDEDEAPAPAQAGRVLPANQVGERELAETKAAMQQLPGTRNETPQGEWPPVPAQSSEVRRITKQDVGEMPAEILVPTIQPHQAQASDNPFESNGDDDLGLRLGDEEDDDEIDLVRQKDAPEGGPFAFQIISAASVPAGPSGFKSIRIRARGLPVTPEAENGIVEDLLSLSDKARFRMDPFLDAIQAPESGKAKRSQLPGKTFWATTKRETRTWQDSVSGEERSTTSTRVKEYLTGPPIEAPKLNGAAPRQKVQPTLGSEFDTDKVPF